MCELWAYVDASGRIMGAHMNCVGAICASRYCVCVNASVHNACGHTWAHEPKRHKKSPPQRGEDIVSVG